MSLRLYADDTLLWSPGRIAYCNKLACRFLFLMKWPRISFHVFNNLIHTCRTLLYVSPICIFMEDSAIPCLIIFVMFSGFICYLSASLPTSDTCSTYANILKFQKLNSWMQDVFYLVHSQSLTAWGSEKLFPWSKWMWSKFSNANFAHALSLKGILRCGFYSFMYCIYPTRSWLTAMKFWAYFSKLQLFLT